MLKVCITLPCKDFVQKVDIFRDNFSVYSKSIFGENRCWRAAFLQWVADRPPGGRAHQHSAHCSAKEGYSSAAQERYHALQCSMIQRSCTSESPISTGEGYSSVHCSAEEGYSYALQRRDTMYCTGEGYWLRTAVTIIYSSALQCKGILRGTALPGNVKQWASLQQKDSLRMHCTELSTYSGAHCAITLHSPHWSLCSTFALQCPASNELSTYIQRNPLQCTVLKELYTGGTQWACGSHFVLFIAIRKMNCNRTALCNTPDSCSIRCDILVCSHLLPWSNLNFWICAFFTSWSRGCLFCPLHIKTPS